ncbi:MAG: serine hydrolase domain-containing protein, partial [Anaerolineae bacterium]
MPKLVLLIALVLFTLMTSVTSAQPPDPPLAPNPLLWIGPQRDVGPVSIVERERALSRLENFLQAVPLRQDPFATIDACVRQEMAQLDVPGAAIAIALDGEMVYERGYGVKHREEGGAVDSNTLFRIGSTTKMMTAAAVMQQVERGAVDLQAPVTDYVPQFDV